ncbi:MAG: hypothetical protein LQ340_000467 [Diploschistes diacapsis]|nr:MAG: hypothetical protein LQ340_000467 [Diploschistes diacapsis]
MSRDYSYATAPDIIRSTEKDSFFQDVLLERLSNAMRRIYGSRFVQTRTSEARALTALLYFGCTTLIGNRTLGEEYCDIVQVEHPKRVLPSLKTRAGYIVSAVLLPYAFAKLAPRLRGLLESNLHSKPEATHQRQTSLQLLSCRLKLYILANLETFTSPSLLYGISLGVFYFSGAYYHISKRVWRLKYVLSKKPNGLAEGLSYEVLGVLLFMQLIIQGWIHVQATFRTAHKGFNVGAENQWLLPDAHEKFAHNLPSHATRFIVALEHTTQTPVLQSPRYSLADDSSMKWIGGEQQRKCTLCLEEGKNPSVATCGHVFCWSCIADWIREKPECPLCRQSVLAQHILPLR